MSFKPSTLQNSPTLRSLQRLALEKGLIKPALKKEASAPAIPESSEHFAENLVSFCAHLRSQGFEKYANEIELKFLLMKKAETASLYGVTGEKGEDLVDFAHPDGGKKLDKDWSELGKVETIFERQKGIQDAILKTPTGKLDPKTAAALINIKTAQGVSKSDTVDLKTIMDPNKLDELLETYFAGIAKNLPIIDDLVQQRGHLSDVNIIYDRYKEKAQIALEKRPIVWGTVEDLADGISKMQGRLETSFENYLWMGGVDKDTWQQLKPYFDQIWSLIGYSKQVLNRKFNIEHGVDVPTKSTTEAPASSGHSAQGDLGTKISTLIGTLGTLKANPKAAGNPKVLPWIDQEIKALGVFLNQVMTNPQPTDAEKLASHQKVIEEVVQKVGG